MIFIDHRCIAHHVNRKKAQRLRWTRSWRRAHKKVKADKLTTKKLVKKATKTFRSFSGISVEEIHARSSANSDYKKAQREAAERAAKAKAAPAAAKKTEKKTTKPAAAKEFVKVTRATRTRITNAVRK